MLPGGFPEEHVGALAANVELRAAVRALADSGAPVHAECGGLLYLCATLDGAPMCDVLPAAATMTARLTLGYRDAVALTPSLLHPVGARVTGHEFHRCAVTPRAADPAWAWRGAEPEGFVHRGVHASFLHTHPLREPEAVARLVAAAAGSHRPSPAIPSAGRSARRSGVAGGRHGGPAVAPGRVVPLPRGVDHADARRRRHDLRRPPDFDYDRLVAHIGERIAFVPRYRQRIRWVPVHLGPTRCGSTTTDFDLNYHVRRSALPRPGPTRSCASSSAAS